MVWEQAVLQRVELRHARPQGGRPVVLRVCAETGEVVERRRARRENREGVEEMHCSLSGG